MFKKIFLLMLVLTLSCSAVLAQEVGTIDVEVEAEELGIKEPGPFYWLKNIIWDVQALVTADPIKKSEFRLKKAGNQLLRARKLAKDNPGDIKLREKLGNLNESYEGIMEEIDGQIGQFQVDNPEDSRLKDFMDKYIAQRLRHQEILEKLEEQVPEEVQKEIKKRREEQLEKFGETMNKLQTSEELKERLQNAIGNVKEDVVRRINRLGIIEQIEGKASPMFQNGINEFKQEQSQIIRQLKDKAGELKIIIYEKAQDFQQGVREKSQEIEEDWEEQKEAGMEYDIQQEGQSFFQGIEERLQGGQNINIIDGGAINGSDREQSSQGSTE